jgi:NAD(P)-dependent dehydrogenase (short-subunit alcohol dehydrogenase family)
MAKGLFDLSGKVTVVTGGNSGLGLGFARGIAKQGGDIEIWARNEEKNAKAKAELEAFGVRVVTRRVDVASEKEVVAAFEATIRDFGRVDTVIANAGLPPNSRSNLEITGEQWRSILSINMDGAFFTLREGARQMVKRAEAGEPGGSLIFCGSLSMLHGTPGIGGYAAAKGALGAVIRSMAVEFGRYGIRANTVAPGFIMTEFMNTPQAEAIEKFFASKTPIPRAGYPKDFEAIAAYLASDASSFHTGDTIVIDGGSVIYPAYAQGMGGV